MPSGRVHAAITAISAAGLLAATWKAGQPLVTTLAVAGGCLAGLLVTPDLDEDRPVRSHALVRRNLGSLPAFLWGLLWFPYARALPHRHWLSHAPVVGTLLRVGYLAGLTWLGCALVGIPWPWEWLPPGWAELMAWALLGLGVSDGLHWAADLSWTRLQRPFGRRRWRLEEPGSD